MTDERQAGHVFIPGPGLYETPPMCTCGEAVDAAVHDESADERLRRECAEVCTSGCHADDCEHHDHLPAERQAGLRDTAAADFAAAAALAEVLHVSVDWATTILAAMPGYRLVPKRQAELREAVEVAIAFLEQARAWAALNALRAALAAQTPAQEDDKTFAADPDASAMWRRAAAQDQLSVTERLAWAMHEARGAYGEYGAEDDCDCLSDAEAWMEAH